MNGLLTWENNTYFVGDPYYFQTGLNSSGTATVTYVAAATANNGEHKRTWNQMLTVSTNLFGSGNQKVAF